MTIWRPAWPCWTLLLFAGLAAVRLIPAGYIRAAVAVPVLLLVPGSLTLGAIFGVHRRPRGPAFICLAAILGIAWAAFAPLALYVSGVLITADSTYVCLLAVSAVLAILAQARILVEPPGTRGQTLNRSGSADPGLSGADPNLPDALTDTARTSATGSRYQAIAAIIGGLGLLVGGTYAIDHLPRPDPAGYTWMAWTRPDINGVVNISAAGEKLPFQIAHEQPDRAAFELEAEWLGNPPRRMAGPVAVTIGPDRTFRGDLFIPPFRNGCTYRIVVTLTAIQPAGTPARDRQTWSINADVRDAGWSWELCPS
jgi:hypothetical protein